MKTVGVLALQGDFEAHRKAFEKLGARAVEVRTAEQMAACDGLVLPGGESTTMLKLLEREQLLDPLRAFGRDKPIYGSCAGAILLAHEVAHPAQPSRIAKVPLEDGGEFEAVFIRAPIITRAGPRTRVLAKYQDSPVWVEQGRHMVTTFHPELTADSRVHRRFLESL
jgi:5'-phosphate synthase pdxT subunit